MFWRNRSETRNKMIEMEQKIQCSKIDPLLNADQMIPDEGETIYFKGGLGNHSLYETKKEDGVYYERKGKNDDWREYNPHERVLSFIQDILR